MTSMQKDYDDYTWLEEVCKVTVNSSAKVFPVSAPSSGKVMLRYIRWKISSTTGTGSASFTISGLARPG